MKTLHTDLPPSIHPLARAVEDDRAVFSRALARAPEYALAPLRAFESLLDDPFELVLSFWRALDESMDAWMLVHPDWEELELRVAAGSIVAGDEERRVRAMLARHRLRATPELDDERIAIESRKEAMVHTNHELDRRLDPYMDACAQRACYRVRRAVLLEELETLLADELDEFTVWRQSVIAHLNTQLERLDASPVRLD